MSIGEEIEPLSGLVSFPRETPRVEKILVLAGQRRFLFHDRPSESPLRKSAKQLPPVSFPPGPTVRRRSSERPPARFRRRRRQLSGTASRQTGTSRRRHAGTRASTSANRPSPGTPPAWTASGTYGGRRPRTSTSSASGTWTDGSTDGRRRSALLRVELLDGPWKIHQRFDPGCGEVPGLGRIPLNRRPGPRWTGVVCIPSAAPGPEIVVDAVADVQDLAGLGGDDCGDSFEEGRIRLARTPVVGRLVGAWVLRRQTPKCTMMRGTRSGGAPMAAKGRGSISPGRCGGRLKRRARKWRGITTVSCWSR